MKRSFLILVILAVAVVAFLAGSIWGSGWVTSLRAATVRQEPGPNACLSMMQGQGMEQCYQFHEQCHALMGSQNMQGMHQMMGAGMMGHE